MFKSELFNLLIFSLEEFLLVFFYTLMGFKNCLKHYKHGHDFLPLYEFSFYYFVFSFFVTTSAVSSLFKVHLTMFISLIIMTQRHHLILSYHLIKHREIQIPPMLRHLALLHVQYNQVYEGLRVQALIEGIVTHVFVQRF